MASADGGGGGAGTACDRCTYLESRDGPRVAGGDGVCDSPCVRGRPADGCHHFSTTSGIQKVVAKSINEQQSWLDRRHAVASLLKSRQEALVVSGLGSSTYDVHAAGDCDANYYL